MKKYGIVFNFKKSLVSDMQLLCGTLMLQKDKKLVEDTKLKVCITLTCADIIFGLSTKTEN